MRVWAVLSLLLLVSSVFVVAAEGDATSVAAAVSAASEDPSTPAASPGFIDGRLDDIKKRVEPVGRGLKDREDKNGPRGPLPYGPGSGGGAGGYIERNGGPDYSERDSIGPRGPNDRDLDQYPDYYPGDEGQPGFGGPEFGPEPYGPPQGGPGFGPGPREGFRDFRGFGGFELPPEAIEGMIFSQIGDTLDEKYGEEKLLAQCGNQPALVNLVLEEFQKTGTNLETEICSEIEEGLSFCAEAKEQCEQIGNPEFGPRFGDEEKPFVPTCPPDENQWKQMCVERMKSEFDRNLAERQEEIESRCREEWEYRPPTEEACKDGKPRMGPDFCDKNEWISNCLERQPPEGDFGPGPQPYNHPGYGPGGPQGQPYGPPQGQPYQPPQQPQCPPLDENAKNACISSGQAWTQQSGPNGCPYITCQGAPQQPPQPVPTQPAATPTLEQHPQPTAAPTVEPTAQPTAPPAEPTPSVTAARAAEWRLEDIPYSSGGSGGGFGQPNKYTPKSPSERCEEEWSRNSGRFQQQCEREKSRNRGPNFNFCNEQEFITQCKAEAEKHMQRDKDRMNPERICAQQVQRDLKHFERYCKDTSRGKERCLKESERGCEFGKKQLARCKELTQPESVKKAIEKAVARECRARSGPGRESRYGKLNEYVSDDYRPVIDYVSDDLTDSDEKLTEAERKERDVLYQLFRTNKDNQQQAQKFRESVEKLDASIKNLESLRESVSEDKRAQFDAEIDNIKKRRDEANQNAKDLEKGSEGILSFFAKLFGG